MDRAEEWVAEHMADPEFAAAYERVVARSRVSQRRRSVRFRRWLFRRFGR